MIKRTYNDYAVDKIINDLDVRPTAQQGTYWLTSSDILDNPANIALTDGAALALFMGTPAPNVYEGHIFALKASRGAKAIHFGTMALRRLRHDYGAVKLKARVPMVLPAARFLCRRIGLKPVDRDLFDEHFETEFD